MIDDDWYGLYREKWGKDLTPLAVSHPAKFSRALIRFIYRHAVNEGWLSPGDSVLDPFAGVACGALDALYWGLNWVGVELEPKFVELGQKNIDYWARKYRESYGDTWGTATIIQGDSRLLYTILHPLTDAVISSPPFLQTSGGTNVTSKSGPLSDPALIARHAAGNAAASYGDAAGQLGTMAEGDFDAAVSSPPYNPPMSQTHNGSRGGKRGTTPSEPGAFVKYGNTPGQLEGLPMDGFDAALGSPPYAEARIGEATGFEQVGHNKAYGPTDGQLGRMKDQGFDASVSSPPFSQPETRDRSPVQSGVIEDCMTRAYTVDRQGLDPANLARLPMDAAVSSPPYSDETAVAAYDGSQGDKFRETGQSPRARRPDGKLPSENYNLDNRENLGVEDFWSAARVIVEQVYRALKPGGHAIWVVKAYVKNKKLVDYPDQWRQLCESVGFKTLHYHRAWVIEDKGTQLDLMGNAHTKTVERKSFFRRLAETHGSPRIDYEVVLCMVKEA